MTGILMTAQCEVYGKRRRGISRPRRRDQSPPVPRKWRGDGKKTPVWRFPLGFIVVHWSPGPRLSYKRVVGIMLNQMSGENGGLKTN